VNFFDAQDRARRATRWLVVVYVICTILIVAAVTLIAAVTLFGLGMDGRPMNLEVLGVIAVASTLLILGSSLYKTSTLSSGGGRVALDMGGTLVPPDVRDPLRKRLRNVVEEMAIASGVPVPEIYVLEHERGINAFAAGYAPGDAAVAVTRGTLELLDRNELQGVIAHEFSHILNGDMRLNIRMMGVLFGIMVVGLIGRLILRSSRHTGLSFSRKNKNAAGIVALGLGLALLGWIGMFFARILKAAVSRRREYLADASAVQFTRQTEGISNALKKIGGFSSHSYISAEDPEEISHMLFAKGASSLTSLLATHPPLTKRIQALDPNFRESDYPVIDASSRSTVNESEEVAGFAGSSHAPVSDYSGGPATSNIADAIGRPEPQHVAFAQQLRSSIPEALYDAAHAPDESFLLTLALALNPDQVERQLHAIEEQLGAARAKVVRTYFDAVQEIGARYRLPLLEIAFPMLRNRPESQMEFMLQLVRKLIELDGQIDLGEFCFYRILASHLGQAADPTARKDGNKVPRKKARNAAIDLIRIVADQGNEDNNAGEHAYQAGISSFGKWAAEREEKIDDEQTVAVLDQSLDALRQMNSAGRKSMLQAVSNTISHDGKLTLREAELLRTICASLDCPLPPILQATLK